MKPSVRSLSIVLLVLAVLAAGAVAPARASGPVARIDEAVEVLREMGGHSDVASLARLVKDAKGVAIFPTVLKAGLGIGGRYGEGLLLRRDPAAGKWYGPHFVTLKGVSYGPQIGVQATSLVLVIANDRGMKGFLGDKVTLGGELAVAAGPVGRQAGAATDVDLKASIYSYSLSKGIFAGLSLEGAVIQPDEQAVKEFWGKPLKADQILERPARDRRVAELLRELEKLLAKGSTT